MCFLKCADYQSLLQLEHRKLEGIIRDYIIHIRQDRKLSPASVSLYIAAVAHFLNMNDVVINWKKIKKYKGKHRTVVEDRPYGREEIKN
jgi:hypothetical protein